MLIVPTLVGVQYQPFLYSILGVSRPQHVHDHFQVGTVRYGIADNFTVVHVEYRREIALACTYIYLRHISCPFLVWPSRGEVAVQYVRCGLADFALVRPVLAASANVLQVFFLHDSVDRLVVDQVPFVPHLRTDALASVSSAMFCMQGLDPLTFNCIAVRFLAEIVVVCGAGQPACLQEMFQGVLAA